MESEQANANQRVPYVDFNTMQLRLNPEPLMQKIEIFLRGEKEISIENDSGDIEVRKIKIGLRKANENGIQSIYNWISSIINVQVVQGNFPVDNHGFSLAYEDFIQYFREEFTEYLELNCYDFDISDNEFNGIIDFSCRLVEAYVTRLIGNEERINYMHTIQSRESNTVSDQKRGGFSLFG